MEKKALKNVKKPFFKASLIAGLILVFSFFWGIKTVRAASLFFSPSSGAFKIGQNFSVSIVVSSAEKAMNATQGTVSFSSEQLEVASLSKSGSIISLWVQEPSFSNGQGAVNFEGIVLNPGFTGSAGKIITINFKAKAVGEAILNFSSGSVLANDGAGTNILDGLGAAQFDINPTAVGPQPSEITTPVEKAGVPLAPQVSSPTHPNPEKWYSNNNPEFRWSLPAGATGVNFVADHQPNTNPGTKSDGIMSAHSYKDTEDGSWYFHLRLKNSYGWGGITHFRFQIDTEKPDLFNIKPIPSDDPAAPTAKFIFEATDRISGLDYYEVKIDGQEAQIWHDDGQHTYQTPVLEPGKHTLFAKAIDRAGNFLMNAVDFSLAALKPPVFDDYPKELPSGNILVIKGKTYPEVQVVIYLQRENDEPTSYQIRSEANGNFIFIAGEKLPDGVYKIWAEAINDKGARSGPSEKIAIIIRPPVFLRLGSLAISIFSVIIPLIALLVLLLLLLWHSWRKLFTLKKKLRKDVHEAETALHEAFFMLNENIWKRIKSLEKIRTKRQLTAEEEKIIKQLKQDLAIAEKAVGKEIEDIEKEVR